MTIKLVIVDDHAIVRAGLRSVILADPELEIIGEASGGTEAISLMEKIHPHVVVLDLSMPDLDGVQVTRHLHTYYPDIHILILTVHEDEALMREVIQSGASGYILKHAAEQELCTAIKKVMSGEMYVDAKLLPMLFNNPPHIPGKKSNDQGEGLSAREKDVLKLIVEGLTNRQIGEELHISMRTVEGHRANIYQKLGLSSRVELVRYARKHNLL